MYPPKGFVVEEDLFNDFFVGEICLVPKRGIFKLHGGSSTLSLMEDKIRTIDLREPLVAKKL